MAAAQAKRRRSENGDGTVFQRSDGHWTATISLGYDGNGKRIRRAVHAKTKEAVVEKLAILKRSAAKSAKGELVAGVAIGDGYLLATDLRPQREYDADNPMNSVPYDSKKIELVIEAHELDERMRNWPEVINGVLQAAGFRCISARRLYQKR